MVDRQGRGGEGFAGGSSSGLADAPTINRNITNKTLIYSSIVCFLAWVFSVYDYTLFGALLPVISDEFGWSTSFGTFILTLVSVGTIIVALLVGPMLDYLGRKPSLVISTVGAALSSGLTGLAPGRPARASHVGGRAWHRRASPVPTWWRCGPSPASATPSRR
jgi:MFS family permease